MIPRPLSRTVIFLTASALPSFFSLLPLDHCTWNVSARECTWKPTENDGRRITGFKLENGIRLWWFVAYFKIHLHTNIT